MEGGRLPLQLSLVSGNKYCWVLKRRLFSLIPPLVDSKEQQVTASNQFHWDGRKEALRLKKREEVTGWLFVGGRLFDWRGDFVACSSSFDG
jgi:hypothetical protein